MSSHKRMAVNVKQLDQSFLRGLLNDANHSNVRYTDRPSIQELPAYVDPALASGAHVVWEDDSHRIYLGDRRSAKSLQEFEHAGIGAVVNCTKRVPCYHRESGIKYCQVAINDSPAADIISYLAGATSFLYASLQKGSVMVHCEVGVSRSSSVVLAFLMRYHDKTRDEAYRHVKAMRPQIEPNEGFWRQLLIYQHHVQQEEENTNKSALLAEEEDPHPIVSLPEDLKLTHTDVITSSWAKESCTTFLLCRDVVSPHILREHCFARSLGSPPADVLLVCLDYIWGRGIIQAELEWLANVCDELNVDIEDVVALITSESSPFCERWCGEVYPEQVERVKRALSKHVSTTK